MTGAQGPPDPHPRDRRGPRRTGRCRPVARASSVSGLCERLVTQGKLEVIPAANAELHPALFAELRRIGNNINQLAHAANGLLPPDVRMMVGNFDKLFKTAHPERAHRPPHERRSQNGKHRQ